MRKKILLKEKIQGGMGFQCIESLNVALLMKQLWRIYQHRHLLISKVLKAKYYRRHCVLESEQKVSDSYRGNHYAVCFIYLLVALMETEWYRSRGNGSMELRGITR